MRPPTALTRRKQLTIKERIPFRVFEQLLANLEPADVKGLVRSDPGGRLVPTKVTPRLRRFEYVINKGSVLEKFFKLDAIDRQPDGPKPGRWRRGLGCCRLWLGGAKEKRGQEAMTVAMVCGNAIVQLHEPTAFRAMPRLTIRMFVMTMDTNGHIIWPVDFVPRTRAALRRQVRENVAKMLGSTSVYPISREFSNCFDQQSDSVLVTARGPSAEQQPVIMPLASAPPPLP